MAAKKDFKQVRSSSRDLSEMTDYLYLEYLEEFRSISRLPHMNLINAFNRFCARALSYISGIDICSRYGEEKRADWQSPEDVKDLMDHNPVIGWKLFQGPITICLRLFGVRPIKISAWKQRQKYNWITRLVRALYLLFNFHLMVNLYFQYSYDFDLMNLIIINEEWQAKMDWERGNTTEFNLRTEQLTSRSRQTKAILDLIGAPNSNMSIVVECFYLYLIILGSITYNWALYLFSIVTNFDYHIGRELLDEKNDKSHYDKKVRAHVMKYIESERIFIENHSLKSRKLMNSETDPTARCSYQTQPTKDQQITNRHLRIDQTRLISRGRISSSQRTNLEERYWQRQQEARFTSSSLRVPGTSTCSPLGGDLVEFSGDCFDACKSLDSMLERDVLKPFNKAPGYIDRRSVLMASYHLGVFVYMVMLISVLLHVSMSHRDPSKPPNLPDTLVTIYLAGLLIIIGVSVNLGATYAFAAVLDEIVATNKMRKLILRCIESNIMQFITSSASLKNMRSRRQQQQQQQQQQQRQNEEHDSLLEFGTPPRNNIHVMDELMQSVGRTDGLTSEISRAYKLAGCVDIMNTNLIFVLMQYKIFVDQYMSLKRTLVVLSLSMTAFIMVVPLILRIHLVYLNVFYVENANMFSIYLSFSVLIASDCNMIPICHLYNRCLDLYRALSSLLAHIIATESDPNGRGLYNHHAVSILTKELGHPHRLIVQFRAGSLGLPCTYTTLVKTHFWWGLIVLSVLADKQFSSQGLVGAIFRDPFGAF